MSQHGPAHQIANGINAGNIGSTLVINKHCAALVQLHTAIVRQQAVSKGTAAHTDNQLIEGFFVLRAIRSHKGHFNGTLYNLCASYSGTQTNIQTLLGKDLLGFFGNRFVHNGQEVFHSLQQNHL